VEEVLSNEIEEKMKLRKRNALLHPDGYPVND
jgi:hypothetical protein